MFLPIGDEPNLPGTPWVTHALIGLNVAVFVLTWVFLAGQPVDLNDPAVWEYVQHLSRETGMSQRAILMGASAYDVFIFEHGFKPADPSMFDLFSSMFLHGGWLHLAGNMLFLWIFGNSVNGKMGHVVYVLFYLACGVFAGVGYAAGNDAPMLGASGSIAGVTTAFVVLFPRAHVTFLYWFLVIGFFELPSMLVIVFKIILWDNVLAPRLGSGMGNVAYAAHLSGYGFGFALALVMLAVRALPRDQFDLLAIARRWYQRRSFAEAMREPEAAARARYGRVARPIVVTQTGTPPADPRQQQIESLREQIAESLDRHDLTGAAELYLQLVGLDPTQVLPRQQQLDVANQLMTLQRFAEALAEVCCRLAELIVADGEGATRVTKVHVRGARSDRAAERVARAVAASPLVRCSWYGAHPDWGRIVSVIGCSRDVDNIRALECRLNGVPVYARGEPLDFDERALRKSLRSRRNLVEIILSDGQGTAAILASDLTHQYVTINAEQET